MNYSNQHKWLITGGAGYIGTHVIESLTQANRKLVVVDDLSGGSVNRIPAGVEFERGSIIDSSFLDSIFQKHSLLGVIHLAALKDVSVSEIKKEEFFNVNVLGTENIVNTCLKFGVKNLIFSSTAAIYNQAETPPYSEDSPLLPSNHYGNTKLEAEELIRKSKDLGLNHVIFRFFNVVGSSSKVNADLHGNNLFPRIISALTSGTHFNMFGADLETFDGSCVRDFIHVVDIAAAFRVVVQKIEASAKSSGIYNLGSGVGVSVKQIVRAFELETGQKLGINLQPKRPEDSLISVANPSFAFQSLDWFPRKDLIEMVASSWKYR